METLPSPLLSLKCMLATQQVLEVKDMAEEQAVVEANRAFYRAIESLENAVMEAVWDPDPSVTCVHPGWPLMSGRDKVLQSWYTIFDNTMVMQFTVSESSVLVAGDLAWVVCTESLRSVVAGRVNEATVEATNVFRNRDGQWRIVHHHGSPVM